MLLPCTTCNRTILFMSNLTRSGQDNRQSMGTTCGLPLLVIVGLAADHHYRVDREINIESDMAVNQKNTKPGQPDDFLRIQDLLYLCLARWKWFVLSLAITTGVAAVYLLCTPAVYTRTASVLIKEDSKGKSVSPDLESFSEFGLFQSSTNVNNELITFSRRL